MAPNETIAGIRKLLREAIGPGLRSEQARFLLRRVMAVLRETDWSEAGFALLAENAVLRALAGEARAALGDAPVPDALARWQSLAASDETPASYAEAEAANRALRQAAAAAIEALRGAPAARAVRRTMVAALLACHN